MASYFNLPLRWFFKRTVLNNVIGPFSTVEYSAEGAFADHLTFDNPLEGTLVLSRALDYETLKTFEVVIVARDQGTPPMESR